MVRLVNKNFVSPLMTARDVCRAFGLTNTKDISDLIGMGYVRRYYQYFKPEQRLIDLTIPPKITIIDIKRINGLNTFHINTIEKIFECERKIAIAILKKYFIKTQYGYWQRKDNLNILLADGENELPLGKEEEEQ